MEFKLKLIPAYYNNQKVKIFYADFILNGIHYVKDRKEKKERNPL